jgi:hypothetical protein
MSPEIVGVAVHAVPVTVRFPPREVRFDPDTVKVLSSVVAPWRVSAPGVVPEPMTLVDEEPAPIVLALDAPVPIVELPLEVSEVNAPLPWLVTPIVVKLPAAGVVVPIARGAAHVAPSNWFALMTPEVAVPPP